jgi:hypothetical protein
MDVPGFLIQLLNLLVNIARLVHTPLSASVAIPSLRATAGSAAIHRRGLCAWIAARRLRRRSQ